MHWQWTVLRRTTGSAPDVAFSLSQAQVKQKVYPLPWAPQIKRAYRSVVARGLLFGFAQWVLVGGACCWLLAEIVLGSLPDWVPWVPWLPLGVAAVVVMFVSMEAAGSAKGALIKTFGYGTASGNTVSGRHSKPPRELRNVGYALACTGTAVGAIPGFAVGLLRAVRWGDGAAVWRMVLCGVLAAAVTILFTWLAARTVSRTWAGWRAENAQQRVAQWVFAHGARAVGVVTAVEFTKQWLDQQPVFVLRVTYPTATGSREVRFHFVDFPRWAPALGNEFDVWYDPERPDDPARTLLQRRIVGQEFPGEVEHLRRPADGGDGPGLGPKEPDWVHADELSVKQKARLYISTVVSLVIAAMMAVSTVIWFAVFGVGVWWLPLPLLAMTSVTAVIAAWWLALVGRAEWIFHTMIDVEDLSWIGFFLMFLNLGGAIWTYVDLTLESGPGGTTPSQTAALLMTGGCVMVAAMVGVARGSEFGERALRVIAAGNTASPDEIHEALRSSDPQALERLRTHHGYVAGVLHSRV